MALYDLDELRSIPVRRICEMYGLKPGRLKHFYYSPFGEKTASLYLWEENGQNRFCDFGGGRNIAGDAIQLVAHICNLEWKDAVQELGQTFGVQPLSKDENDDFELSERQWEKIGIKGDLAPKNFDFSYHGPNAFERMAAIINKYDMTMNELRKKHSGVYQSVLERRAFSYCYACQQQYFQELDGIYLSMKMSGYDSFEKMTPSSFESIKKMVDELKTMEQFLKQAMKGTHLKFKFQRYDIEKDFQKIVSGEMSMEVGSVLTYDMKKNAESHNKKLDTLEVDVFMYDKIRELNFTFPYSAVQTKDKVLITAETKNIRLFENMVNLFHYGLDIGSQEHKGLKEKIDDASGRSNSETKNNPTERASER